MTKKVTCDLPNVSDEISGVKFELQDGVAVANGLDDETAALFEGIPGYTVEDAAEKVETAAEKKAREKAEKAAAEKAAATKPAEATADGGAAAAQADTPAA